MQGPLTSPHSEAPRTTLSLCWWTYFQSFSLSALAFEVGLTSEFRLFLVQGRTEFLPDVVQPFVLLAIWDHSLRPTSLSNVPPHFLFQIVSDPVTTTERITLVQCIQMSGTLAAPGKFALARKYCAASLVESTCDRQLS